MPIRRHKNSPSEFCPHIATNEGTGFHFAFRASTYTSMSAFAVERSHDDMMILHKGEYPCEAWKDRVPRRSIRSLYMVTVHKKIIVILKFKILFVRRFSMPVE